MKKIFKIFIPLVIVGALVYQFRSTFNTQFSPILDYLKTNFNGVFLKAPCTEPISYTLGTFDTKFSISKDYFLSALAEAEIIWEKPFNKQLFTYTLKDSSNDVLKINLVFDYRQEATSKLVSLGIVVKEDRASYDMLKIKFTNLQAKLTVAKNDYNARVQSFNLEQKVYQQQVEYWNTRERASKAEYDKLQAEKISLETQLFEIKSLQAKNNEMINEINALVVVLNRLANILNISVDQYNAVNGARGESFEEGVFTSDGQSKQIDIYEFSSRAKLVRVLAHELGHALGIDHVDDPKAIMYRLNQGNSLTLTQDDLYALKTKCQTK